MSKRVAYVSVDTENDGAEPSSGNMLELGVVALDAESGAELLAFVSPLRRRDDRPGDALTLQWLREHGMYERLVVRTAEHPEPRSVMTQLATRLQTLVDAGYRLVWVARPAAYDWMWLWTYWCQYGPEAPP